jgi:hypothetical protein
MFTAILLLDGHVQMAGSIKEKTDRSRNLGLPGSPRGSQKLVDIGVNDIVEIVTGGRFVILLTRTGIFFMI